MNNQRDYYKEAKAKHGQCIAELQRAHNNGLMYYLYTNGKFQFSNYHFSGFQKISKGLKKHWG